jgi:hypothetical protein
VTVCIAAICKAIPTTLTPNWEQQKMIIGAADRMLTVGEIIEYEPEATNKIYQFSSAIFAMLAGDFGMQTEILRGVISTVNDRIAAEPEKWLDVKWVAEMYAENFKKCHLCRAENAILAPQGLDLTSFLKDQKNLNPEFVKQIASKLAQFQSPGVEAILCGHDVTGAHIYVVDNSANVTCHDVVGFAAIGIGNWHANSQFMFANHTPFRGFAETLLLTYSAKKRAEVAPGVGADTDMFIVGPFLGQCVPSVAPHVLDKLYEAYKSNLKRKQKIDKNSQIKVGKYLDEIVKKEEEKAKQQSTSPSTTAPAPPSEQSQPSVDPTKKQP